MAWQLSGFGSTSLVYAELSEAIRNAMVIVCLPTWLRLELIYELEKLVSSAQAASFSCSLPTAGLSVSEIFLHKLST